MQWTYLDESKLYDILEKQIMHHFFDIQYNGKEYIHGFMVSAKGLSNIY